MFVKDSILAEVNQLLANGLGKIQVEGALYVEGRRVAIIATTMTTEGFGLEITLTLKGPFGHRKSQEEVVWKEVLVGVNHFLKPQPVIRPLRCLGSGVVGQVSFDEWTVTSSKFISKIWLTRR